MRACVRVFVCVRACVRVHGCMYLSVVVVVGLRLKAKLQIRLVCTFLSNCVTFVKLRFLLILSYLKYLLN